MRFDDVSTKTVSARIDVSERGFDVYIVTSIPAAQFNPFQRREHGTCSGDDESHVYLTFKKKLPRRPDMTFREQSVIDTKA